MNDAEIGIGIVVTLVLAAVLVYAVFKIWAVETHRPTESIVPK